MGILKLWFEAQKHSCKYNQHSEAFHKLETLKKNLTRHEVHDFKIALHAKNTQVQFFLNKIQNTKVIFNNISAGPIFVHIS